MELTCRCGGYALFAVIALFSLGACTETAGEFLSGATGEPSVTGSQQPSASAGQAENGSQWAASADPCSLLSADELAEFGEFEGGVFRPVGSGRSCRWSGVRESAGEEAPIIDLMLRSNGGLDTFPDLGGGRQGGHTDTLGRKVVKTSNERGCVVAMAVGASARVEVVAGSVELDQACAMAGKIAETIDTKIPMG